jgi:hypothetical protein
METKKINIEENLNLLGLKVRDIVSGIEGIVTHVGFDLFGCVQVILRPEYIKETGVLPDTVWLDVCRLEVLSKKPVLPLLDFIYTSGPSEKPRYNKM